MSVQIALALGVFVAAYVLIAVDRLPRAAVSLSGAAAMVVIGATDGRAIFFSERSGIDWSVIFLLAGMMMIVGIMRQSGVFEFLAIWSAKRARARPFRIMVMLVLITAVGSAFLDNVTTVLLIAPVTFQLCRRLELAPVPYLIAEVMASNIGGTATLIGDPPNIIIASRGQLNFNDFVRNVTPVIVIILVVFIAVCRVMFAGAFRYDPDRARAVMELDARAAITDGKLLRTSLLVLALVLAGFVLEPVTGISPAVVALLGAGLLLMLTGLQAANTLNDIEWETLLFFAGLFVMVGALVNLGVIDTVGEWIGAQIHGHYLGASLGVLAGSGALSGIVDNIPYVATMSPVVADLVHTGGSAAHPLWWALALGADLGGNATAIGASANVVVIGMARRAGHPISFWTFTKYGLIVTAITIAIAGGYLATRYYL